MWHKIVGDNLLINIGDKIDHDIGILWLDFWIEGIYLTVIRGTISKIAWKSLLCSLKTKILLKSTKLISDYENPTDGALSSRIKACHRIRWRILGTDIFPSESRKTQNSDFSVLCFKTHKIKWKTFDFRSPRRVNHRDVENFRTWSFCKVKKLEVK